ncbi:MAG TPA: PIN domain-containing protein [Acidimicrobiales bacterium]|nr:PIN domain-containing protein [Acidimicrobiales bacterium]
MTRVLVDTSVVNRFASDLVAIEIEDAVEAGDVAVCAPVIFEVCFSAQNGAAYERLRRQFDALPQVRTHQAVFDRAIEVQGALCAQGRHRGVSMADLLIAAAAEAADLPVVHYDADFDLIAEVTGQPSRWVVPRGLID